MTGNKIPHRERIREQLREMAAIKRLTEQNEKDIRAALKSYHATIAEWEEAEKLYEGTAEFVRGLPKGAPIAETMTRAELAMELAANHLRAAAEEIKGQSDQKKQLNTMLRIRREIIYEHIKHLKPIEQQIIILKYEHGLKRYQIAQRLHYSEEAISWNEKCAIEKLYKMDQGK